VIRAGLIAALSALIAPVALGQEAPEAAEAPGTIIEVRVEGNQVRGDEEILATIKTRVGQVYNQEVIRNDEQRLLASNRYDSVVVTRTVTERGVIVTFKVDERPMIKRIRFVGNKALSDRTLSQELTFTARSPLHVPVLRRGREAIEAKYKEEGYPFVSVTFDETQAIVDEEVVYEIVEGPRVRVRDIRVEGNEHFSTFRIKLQIGSSERFWPFIAGDLDTQQVALDVQAIRKLYVEEGFLEAQVDRLLEFSDDKEDCYLTFVINEGPRFQVNDLIFEGNTVFSDEQLSGRLVLQRGDFVQAEKLRRDIEAIRDAYGTLGYIEARVRDGRQYLAPDAPRPDWAADQDADTAFVNLVFEVVESDHYDVGRVIIRGNDLTQDRVIRRHLRFFPEKRLDTVAMRESERRLRETTLFGEVSVKPVGDDPDYRDVLVQVTEGQTANFIIGVGVNTNTGLLGNITFRQRNFDILGWPRPGKEWWKGRAWKGAGQQFTLHAAPGTDQSSFNISWFEPAMFDQPYSLDVNMYLSTHGRESYDIMRLGLVTSVGHRFKNRWYGQVSVQTEWTEIRDLSSDAPPEVVKVEGDYFMPSVKGMLVRDRTDSRFLPSKGDRLQFSYEQFFGDFAFGKAEASYRIYRTLYVDATDRKHILAGRVGLNQIVGDAPVFERYYAGGIGSIRGFEYRGVSPRSSAAFSDDPIGGETMLLLGAEYTYPLVTDQIRGVVFVDTGTVEEDFSVDRYRVSAGFGLRWTIPFFGPVPLSLDFGFPIVEEDEDETQVFSFSLGWQW
jgi:outer membrane protein assembly complex protein YaeT